MRNKLRMDLIETLKKPRTIEEIADLFGVHYQTAYSYIKVLRNEDLVVELSMRRDGKLLFILGSEEKPDGPIQLYGEAGSYTPVEVIELIGRYREFMEKVESALAQIYMRSYGEATGEAYLKGVATTEYCRRVVKSAHDMTEGLAGILKQLLVNGNIWLEDNPKVFERWGDVSMEVMRDLSTKIDQMYTQESSQKQL